MHFTLFYELFIFYELLYCYLFISLFKCMIIELYVIFFHIFIFKLVFIGMKLGKQWKIN
jgi:hypothetical protein